MLPKNLYTILQRQVPMLQMTVKQWIKEMMEWHFSEETGCPFWLEKKKDLPFDPLDIKCIDDLSHFGLFNKEELIRRPIKDFIPLGFKDQPRRIFETGGTTGAPCRIAEFESEEFNVNVYYAMLKSRGCDKGDALAMIPSGPHAYGNFVSRLMNKFHSNTFFIDFDPRWVKRLIRDSQSIDGYIEHLIQQAMLILQTQSLTYLFTTTKLLSELLPRLKHNLYEYGIRVVCTGGTSLSREEAKVLREEYLQEITWIDTYGNTLMRGHALQNDPVSLEEPITYHLLPPVGFLRVVDPADWRKTVAYGQRGQIIVTTLFRDILIPNLAERDSAVRVKPASRFPWDGISEIEAMRDNDPKTIVEGIY